MSRLPRPYIPLSVRIEVAKRQVLQQCGAARLRLFEETAEAIQVTQRGQLFALLGMLFADAKSHLDHEPPLAARTKIVQHGEVVAYRPDANDPRWLVYRTAEDHRRKTYLRGDGAQFSDRVLIKRERRREKAERPRPTKIGGVKKRWPSRKLSGASRWPTRGSSRWPTRKLGSGPSRS